MKENSGAQSSMPVESSGFNMIDMHKSEPSFCDEIAQQPGCDTIFLCYQCGVCTGTCPVSEVDERFSPAWIIQWVRLGLRELVLRSPLLWYCLQCHRCSFHCPQGVRFADINAALRDRAVEEGFITADRAAALHQLEQQLRRIRIELLNQAFEQSEIPKFDLSSWQSRESGTAGVEMETRESGEVQSTPAEPEAVQIGREPENVVVGTGEEDKNEKEQANQDETESNRQWDSEESSDENEEGKWDWNDAGDDGDPDQW